MENQKTKISSGQNNLHWYQKPSDITNLFEAMCKNGIKEQLKKLLAQIGLIL